MAQLYINDIGFVRIYPMKNKREIADTLSTFIHDIGLPHTIHSDDAKELVKGKFKSLCKEYSIPTTSTEPYSPWQNWADGGIRELKCHDHRKMKACNVDICSRWSCDISSKSSSDHPYLNGRTPHEAVTGITPDISSVADFNFYEPVWYFD